MHTLIFDGSPHQNGDTAALIQVFRENLQGESTVIRAYGSSISPCVDCRTCWKQPKCAIRDGMQDIYPLIEESDAIVIACPIYYSELTGPLLSLLSRLQVYYCARRFQGIRLNNKEKRGGMLLVGGGDGGPEKALSTARTLLRCMNAKEIAEPVMTLHTDHLPAASDTSALSAARALADYVEKRM
ncbi:MAG: flavodoxin family protein [Clostridiales bacterium]|nr:flavodoxin family protein [Clostridiales bacterium]